MNTYNSAIPCNDIIACYSYFARKNYKNSLKRLGESQPFFSGNKKSIFLPNLVAPIGSARQQDPGCSNQEIT